MSFLSFNVHGQGVKDEGKFMELVRVTRPEWVLIMDNFGLAQRVRYASPNTKVIIREWYPDGTWVGQSPEKWYDYVKSKYKGFWVYTDNEVGLRANWHNQLIKIAAGDGFAVNIVACNTSVGTPSFDEWNEPEVQEMLKLMDKHRKNVVLGVHEYCHAVPTSGAQGASYRIKPSEWPSVLNTTFADYHIGRIRRMVESCKGFRPPRVVITEFGIDALGDMERIWFKGSHGYKEMLQLWSGWFSGLSASASIWMISWYAWYFYYARLGCVEGLMWYCYGHIDKHWEDYDIEDDAIGMLHLIANDTKPSLLSHVVRNTGDNSPVVTPSPKYSTYIAKVSSLGLNVRLLPTTSSAVIESINNGDTIEVSVPPFNGWYQVRVKGKVGYSFASLLSLATPQTGGDFKKFKHIGPYNVNVRAEGNIAGKLLGVVKVGQDVEAVAPAVNGWYRVRVNGAVGYCSSQYLLLG